MERGNEKATATVLLFGCSFFAFYILKGTLVRKGTFVGIMDKQRS
jgi:hypothetical protein